MQARRSSKFLGWTTLVSLGAVTVACGGSTKEAGSVSDIRNEAPVTASPEASSEAPDDESVSTAEDESGGETVSVTTEEFQEALQIVLDDEALREGLQLGEPGRFPLKISGADIPSNVMVKCVGEDVQVLQNPEDTKSNPVLVFLQVEFKGTMGTFKYRHDVAGIQGTTKVKRDGDRWELMASRVNNY
jgi:hypothetical protein